MKYLAVDLGNVICEVNFSGFLDKLSSSLNLSMDDVHYFLNRTQKLHDLGLTNIADELRDHFKIKSPVVINSLMEEWKKTVNANKIMISALKDLVCPKEGDPVKLALLSNIGLEHSALMQEILTEDVFNNSIKFFSCEVGVRKPSYIYYKLFLDMYPEFKGCVYLDDRPENVIAGNKFGFRSFEFALDKFVSESDLVEGISYIKRII